ncbi:DUF177 domain-containing protein [Streptococcus plurextorum]|uniref:DUF177 domain-containing protein n=1 Tax=Streptococcus plurextorum TaxID=456876 RepID=UPI00042132AE|nr:YceD family protein [Streptococcus plurextorum]
MFNINDIKKKLEGVAFDCPLEIKTALLERESGILDVANVTTKGHISYESGLYLLNYQLNYDITLPSSRSMTPVTKSESLTVEEVFIEHSEVDSKSNLVEDDLVLIIEGEVISLEESVIDNILLNIPLRVLTKEEEQDNHMPSGQSWSVMTEEQYQAQLEEKKLENNPFSGLDGLFKD